MTEHKVKKEKKYNHGTIVKFIPSEKHLRSQLDIKAEFVEDWIRRLSYLIPEGITMKFVGIKKNSEGTITKKYTAKTLKDNVEYLSPSLEIPPILLESNEVSYEDNGEDVNMILKLAFSYDKSLDGDLCDGYCNYVHNLDGGTHIDACKSAISSFFVREAKKMDPNSKYEIISDDCKKGLILAVNCMHTDPMFGGQSKNRVENKSIIKEGRGLITDMLKKYFENNNTLLKRVINYFRNVAKARIQTNKIRGIDAKKNTTFLEDSEIKGFFNIANRNYQGYKELYITEGDEKKLSPIRVI